MWRPQIILPQEDSLFFESFMERIKKDSNLQEKAEQILIQAEQDETLIKESYGTPQSPTYHGEGPFLRDHLKLFLQSLHAIVEGGASLLTIEEFRGMKGYEGEIQEMEEVIKENVALFEVFALCHDVAKWSTVYFSAKEGTRGAAAGFSMKREHNWEKEGLSERAKMRTQYLELYEEFASKRTDEFSWQTQSEFALSYGINVHYPGHDRAIHAPVYRALLERMGERYRLPEHDIDLLEDLISHHLSPLKDFSQVRPNRLGHYYHFSRVRGYDADDFIDRLQACVFLDAVCASLHRGAHGTWHEMSLIQNFFRSEHDYAPERRVEKQLKKEEGEQQVQNHYFREVGLDGVALMKLLRMAPGPMFGKVLYQIQQAVLGKGKMPDFDKNITKEIEERSGKFFEFYFQKGQ